MYLYPRIPALALVALYSGPEIAFAQPQTHEPGAPSVTIASGVLIGTAVSLPAATAPVNRFLGIPFAASPPERFGTPQEPAPWSEPLNVTTYKPACIQQFNYPEPFRSQILAIFNNPPLEESEDCLYINVWAPSSPAPDNGRTVMFWIYGGGLVTGGTSTPFFEATSFAAIQDVVIVSAGYRLNAFGFPSAPELSLQERNLGFLDQRFALEWVQKNIAAFGGDPQKVTIFGESSGAGSVDRLITTLPDNPPFRAAITESGQASTSWKDSPNGTAAWQSLISLLNCTSGQSALDCARAVPALTIKSVIEHAALSFFPVTDNVTQIADPKGARAQGNIAKVPLLTGTNAQEGAFFTLGQSNISGFLSTNLFPNDTDLQTQVANTYVLGADGLNTPHDVLSKIYTDLVFQCPVAATANSTAALSIPTYRYYLNASFANYQIFPGAGAFHASELALVFGTYPRENATQQEINLSLDIQTAWAGFAKDPEQGPGWARIGSSENDVAVLGSDGGSGAVVVPQGTLDGRCAVFEALYASVTSPIF
ncbi:MAG: hypothetical protein M1836_003331 [Candelina mexicana]|nr:MAG: hypothetical protein M1836_003331 [Candelina mexicana]